MAIHLGDISFGIGADTRRLGRSIQDIRRFGQAIDYVAQQSTTGSRQLERQMLKQERASINALQKVQRFQDQLSRMPDAPAHLMTRATVAMYRYSEALNRGILSQKDFQRASERFNVTMNNLARQYNHLAIAAKKAEQNKLNVFLDRLSAASILAAGPLSGIAARFSVISSLSDKTTLSIVALIAALTGAVYGFYRMSRAMITVSKELEGAKMALEAVSGSSTLAQVELNYLAKFADQAGQSFQDLIRPYSKLMAASAGTSLEGDRMRKVFEAIVLAGTKMQLSTEDVAGTLKALEQMISKGKVQAEELRGQLGDRLPGALSLAAKAMGLTGAQLSKLMEDGKLYTEDFLPKFGEAVIQHFGIDPSQAIDTTVAAENRLRTAFFRLNATLDKTIGVSNLYRSALKSMTDGLNWLTSNLDVAVKAVGALSGALAALLGPAIISGMLSLAAAVGRVAISLVGLSTVVAATPIGRLITILAGVGLVLGGAAAGAYLLDKSLGELTQTQFDALPTIDEYIKAQENLGHKVTETTRTYIKQAEVLAEHARLMNEAAQMQYAEALVRSPSDSRTIEQIAQLEQLREQVDATSMEYLRATERIEALYEILARQEEFKTQRTAFEETEEAVGRTVAAIQKAKASIEELETTYEAMQLRPGPRALALMQIEVNKQIADFEAALISAKVPLEEVKNLTEQYAVALQKVSEQEFIEQHTIDMLDSLVDSLQSAATKGFDTFVDGIIAGKFELQSLVDVARDTVAAIIKEFFRLAVVNQILNSIFGMSYPTLRLGGLGGGGGGGSLSLSSSASVRAIESLPTLGRGLERSSREMSTAAEVMSLASRRGRIGSGSDIASSGDVYVYNYANTRVETRKTTNPTTGATDTEVMIYEIVEKAAASSISSGGRLAGAIEGVYGANRTKGIPITR